MKGSILIVDDDANMRESIADNLQEDGYETAQASSGAEALSTVVKRSFDVIIMDYNLGDLTGIEVIQKIRAIDTRSQILMLTAHASLDTAVKAIQESVADFMSKPVDFDRLKHSILKAFEKLRLEEENRRLLADLKETNEQLTHLNQMKSKFLSMSSHDLSNSLMTLQVSFELLSQSITPSAEQTKHMAYIVTGIGQIARLIEDLVDWAAIEQGKFRLKTSLFAPGTLVEKSLAGPQGRAKSRGLTLSIEAQSDLPMIRGDEKRILQVINNLLENAMRHTSRGGKVAVEVARRGKEVEFTVKDTGEGIAQEDLTKIFESFCQTKSQAGGGRLGLGLSIAKEIVQSHQGRLWAESPGSGLGAAFHFTIPVPEAVS